LAGKIATTPHDRGEPRTGDLDVVVDAAFAAEIEHQPTAPDLRMTVA